MRFLILSCTVFAMFSGFAQAQSNPNTLSVAIGASVPKDPSGQTFVETSGPSRASGGEHFILKMATAKTVTDIKITGYSTGRAGKSLIHSVTALMGSTPVAIPELSQFAKIKAGNPQNYQGLVMLPDSTYVETTPNQAFNQLDFVIEGYTNDDASILLQITTSEGLLEKDFLLTRTGPHQDQVVGAMIDEATFAKFSGNDLNKLMTQGTQPQAADLAGKTLICSSYTRLSPAEIDLKTRSYVETADGGLLSSSDMEGQDLPWSVTADGLTLPIENQNGCGTYMTYNVLRKTAQGNFVAEVVVDLEAYVSLCTNAGYDGDGTRAVETNSTFPSTLAPKYVVDSYEFCRPTK